MPSLNPDLVQSLEVFDKTYSLLPTLSVSFEESTSPTIDNYTKDGRPVWFCFLISFYNELWHTTE